MAYRWPSVKLIYLDRSDINHIVMEYDGLIYETYNGGARWDDIASYTGPRTDNSKQRDNRPTIPEQR